MANEFTQKTLVVGSAAAISAIGLLTGAAPAQALPMFPLAPACSFNGTYVLNQSNGFEKNREPMLRVMRMHRDAAYAIRNGNRLRERPEAGAHRTCHWRGHVG